MSFYGEKTPLTISFFPLCDNRAVNSSPLCLFILRISSSTPCSPLSVCGPLDGLQCGFKLTKASLAGGHRAFRPLTVKGNWSNQLKLCLSAVVRVQSWWCTVGFYRYFFWPWLPSAKNNAMWVKLQLWRNSSMEIAAKPNVTTHARESSYQQSLS